MHAQERIPIQLICRFPSPVSPAESRPTPLTSPTLGNSRRLSSRREEAALLALELVSPEDVSEEAAPLTAEDAAAEAAGRDTAGALEGAEEGSCTTAGGALLGGGGGVSLCTGGALETGGSLTTGVSLTTGATLATVGSLTTGASLDAGLVGKNGSSDDASGMAVLQNSDAVRTAHQIHSTERKKRFLFLFIQNSPAIPFGRLVRVRRLRTRRNLCCFRLPERGASQRRRCGKRRSF